MMNRFGYLDTSRSGSTCLSADDYFEESEPWLKRTLSKELKQIYVCKPPSSATHQFERLNYVLIEKQAEVRRVTRITQQDLDVDIVSYRTAGAGSEPLWNGSDVLFLKKEPRRLHIMLKLDAYESPTPEASFPDLWLTSPVGKKFCVLLEKSSIIDRHGSLSGHSVEEESSSSTYGKLLQKYHELMDVREGGKLSSDQEKELSNVEQELDAHESSDLNLAQRIDRAFDDSEEIRQLRELNRNIKELLARGQR